MTKAYVKVTKTTTRMKTTAKSQSKKRGNPNKCPVCGKFMGSGSHG